MINIKIQNKLSKLPSMPGVYFYYDKNHKLIYVGKASVLKNRVKSYFVGAHDTKTMKLVSEIDTIKWQETKSVIEALILESNLIKKYQPKYNIREKDDKSFVQIVLTDEEYPRLIAIRPTQKETVKYKIKKYYGPYTNPAAVKEILAIFRRVFTFRDCTPSKFARSQKHNTPCINFALHLCPAPCTKNITKQEYHTIVKQMTDFLEGKRTRVISSLKRQMQLYSKSLQYEKAAMVRDRLFAFQHINDIAVIKEDRPMEQIKNIPHRIEAYDISNLGKDFAVGSMVVFIDGEIEKAEYRRFRILYNANGILQSTKYKIQNTGLGDPQMMAQVIDRRFNHGAWAIPNLILLDGGKGQLSATTKILRYKKIKLPVIAVAKGPTRKGYKLFRNNHAKRINLDRKFIESIRDEAHRFAISYHRKLKRKSIVL